MAVAEGVRGGEVRPLGTLPHCADHVRKLVEKLEAGARKLHFCNKAGPCGYGLHRQLVEMGHDCLVVAPSLSPVKTGDLAGHFPGQQPITILREDGWSRAPIVNAQAHETTEQQVLVHLFHELPLRADRVEDLQQAGPDQTFRRDGGPTLTGVKPIKLGIQRAEGVVHNSPNLRRGCRAGIRSSRST